MSKRQKKFFITLRIARLTFYLIFFLTFIIIPTEVFLDGTICLIRIATGMSCPTCGVTRAFSSIMHLNIIDAFQFNPIFTIMIFPICVSVFIQDAFIIIRDFIKRKEVYSLIEYIFVS